MLLVFPTGAASIRFCMLWGGLVNVGRSAIIWAGLVHESVPANLQNRVTVPSLHVLDWHCLAAIALCNFHKYHEWHLTPLPCLS